MTKPTDEQIENYIEMVNLGKQYELPQVETNKRKGYATFGTNNTGFTRLINAYKGSTTNGAILGGQIKLVKGKGITAKNADKNASQLATVNSMLRPKEFNALVTDDSIGNNCAILVTRAGKTAVLKHIPIQMVAPSLMDEKGNVQEYFVSLKFGSDKHPRGEVKSYPNFDLKPDAKESIKYIKDYSIGDFYFADVDYLGGIPYAETEIALGTYHLTNVKTAFSPKMAISFVNGVGTSTTREAARKQVGKDFSGESGKTVLMTFNNNKDSAPIITPLAVRDIHNQYDFIGSESQDKIILAHNADPQVYSIKTDSSGLANNAEELQNRFTLYNNMAIIPRQTKIIDGLQDIFRHYKISLELYVKSLKPNEFYDIEGITTDDEIEDKEEQESLSKSALQEFIELGVSELEGYELIDESPVDYETIETDDYSPVYVSNLEKIVNFVTTGTARPNSKSEQDGEDVVIRYQYKGHSTGERAFCNAMLKADKLYRKEDIIQMESKPVNPGFGLDGVDTYPIWLWKGGGLKSGTFPNGTCKHFWQRKIFLKQGVKVDVNSPLSKTISTSEARRKGFKVPTNDSKVSIAPHNMK